MRKEVLAFFCRSKKRKEWQVPALKPARETYPML